MASSSPTALRTAATPDLVTLGQLAQRPSVAGAVEAVRDFLGMEIAFTGEFVETEQIFRILKGDGPSFGISEGGRMPLRDTYCERVLQTRLPNLIPDVRREERAAALSITEEAEVGAFVSRYEAPPSIAILDLDAFKSFNDEFGHLAGDEMLRETAAAWQPKLRTSDMMARFGGDEFTCLFPNCNLSDAVGILERMRKATPARMTASIGVAEWDGSEGLAHFFERADQALYRAKQAGRDQTAVG